VECETWRYCPTVARRQLAPGLACGQETDTAMLPAAAVLSHIRPSYLHITSPLQGPTIYCYLGKQSMFTVRTTRNTQIYIYINSVRISQETHYVSATKSSRLMLFRQTVAVYCENHTDHTDTLCGPNAEFQCVKANAPRQEE
jgi:hypothetical protein